MFGLRKAVFISMMPLLLLSCGDKPDVSNIAVQNTKADPDESVVSFELDVSSGTVQAVSHLPIGWQIAIENDASWKARVKGTSTVGAASLTPDEMKRVVFVVRRNESTGVNFNVSGFLQVSKVFVTRKVPLNMKDFALTSAE